MPRLLDGRTFSSRTNASGAGRWLQRLGVRFCPLPKSTLYWIKLVKFDACIKGKVLRSSLRAQGTELTKRIAQTAHSLNMSTRIEANGSSPGATVERVWSQFTRVRSCDGKGESRHTVPPVWPGRQYLGRHHTRDARDHLIPTSRTRQTGSPGCSVQWEKPRQNSHRGRSRPSWRQHRDTARTDRDKTLWSRQDRRKTPPRIRGP